MVRFTILTLLVLTFSVGCKEDYVLKGRLMSTCDVPASNEELTLRVGGKMYGERFEVMTDANGYFVIPYESTKNKPLYLRNKMSGIPVGNLDIGNVYTTINYSVIVSLSVNNPYTSADTLILEGKEYAGPFQSGVIDTLENLYLQQNEEEIVKYGIKEYPQVIQCTLFSNGLYGTKTSEEFTFELCSGGFSEAIFVID